MRVSRFLALALVSSACATPQRQARQDRLKPKAGVVVALSMPADLRATYVRTSADGRSYVFCAEPAPDVALSSIVKFEAEGRAPGETNPSGKLVSGATTTSDELSGRSQTVLLARELLYRNCELLSNGVIDKPLAKKNFLEVLNVVQNLAIAEKVDAKARLGAETQQLGRAQVSALYRTAGTIYAMLAATRQKLGGNWEGAMEAALKNEGLSEAQAKRVVKRLEAAANAPDDEIVEDELEPNIEQVLKALRAVGSQ